MSLIDIKDGASVDSNSLLKLLEQNDAVAGYFFAYDAQSNLIQLRSSFSNRGITAKQLKSTLVQIASFAEKHSELWSKLKAKPAAKPAETAKTTTNSTKPAVSGTTVPAISPSSLVGMWGGSLKTGESIAIQISSDNSFKLATVKSGKSSIFPKAKPLSREID